MFCQLYTPQRRWFPAVSHTANTSTQEKTCDGNERLHQKQPFKEVTEVRGVHYPQLLLTSPQTVRLLTPSQAAPSPEFFLSFYWFSDIPERWDSPESARAELLPSPAQGLSQIPHQTLSKVRVPSGQQGQHPVTQRLLLQGCVMKGQGWWSQPRAAKRSQRRQQRGTS